MKETNFKTDTKGKESKKPDIKIFVSHRIDMEAETIDNPLYVNVRCGAVYDKRENIDMLGDDTGDNISEKRESFNELTVQYWAWKNVDADYYGLCHYRRYFSFSDDKFNVDENSYIVENYINRKNIEQYDLCNIKNILSLLDGYELIVTEPADYKYRFKNLYEQYSKEAYLNVEHIDIMLDIIKEKYPDYYQYAIKYIYSDKLIPCNMFIMSKKVFNKYNTFLFDILNELERQINIKKLKLSSEGIRVFSHLGERLLGIFIRYMEQNNCKVKYLQRILFTKPEKNNELFPVFNNSINIVLSSSDYYVPYLYTTIYSLLQYKEEQDIYDIVILTTNISKNNITYLKQLETYKANVYITIYDIGFMIGNYIFKVNNHISVETFYRLFIPIIFKNFEYIIYIDCDIIVKRNIADIVRESNLNYTINATKDPDYISQYYSLLKVKEYTKKVIKLENVENYFQAGVLVFNVRLFNERYSVKKLLDFASSREFMYLDQDVMNSFFRNDVFYLDMKWNCITDYSDIRKENIRIYAPNNIYKDYLETIKNPYIIHYAGVNKPWNRLDVNFANEYWEIARKTPFYEMILYRMIHEQSSHISFATIDHFSRIMFPFKWLKKVHKIGYIRQIADRLLPHGTKRRKIVKKLVFG